MNVKFEGRVARLTCGLVMVVASGGVFSLPLTAADATDQTLAGVAANAAVAVPVAG